MFSNYFKIIICSLALLLTPIFFVNANNLDQKDVLIKGGTDAVYYYASDGKRYVFPNQRIYNSWFSNFDGIVQVTDEELASTPLGGNIRYRPGIKLVKIQSDPKVYAVDQGGFLRWVTSEQVAVNLYGTDWSKNVDDVSVAFFVDYKIGANIVASIDFVPDVISNNIYSINANRGLPESLGVRMSDTQVKKYEGRVDIVPTSNQIVDNLQVVDTGLNGRVLLTWNEWPEDLGFNLFFIFRKKVGENNFLIVDTSTANLYEDKYLENNTQYLYKVIPARTSVVPTFDDAGSSIVAVTTTSEANANIDKLVFVIPEIITINQSDYFQIINNLIAEVNKIYRKNTSKQFSVEKVIVYNEDVDCGSHQSSRCRGVFENQKYYVPGGISVFLTRTQEVASPREAPATGVGMKFYHDHDESNSSIYYDGDNEILRSSALGKYVSVLAHELGHLYGLGSPELYNYRDISDKTGVSPVLPQNGFISSEYSNDVMQNILNTKELAGAKFGPVSAYILNNNSDRSRKSKIKGASSFPKKITAKIIDSSGKGISDAVVKVFCASRSQQLQEGTPRFTGLSNSAGELILQESRFDEFGNPVFIRNRNIFDNRCEINILKIYKSGFRSVAVSVTSLDLQEQSLIRGIDDYVVTVTLSEE